MARQETFYQRPLDRTPYQACAWVGIIIAVIGVVCVVGIWKLASTYKHNVRLPANLSKPNLNTDKTLNDIQQQVQDQIDQKKQDATDAATKAAKDAVTNEVEKQKEQLLQK